MQKKLSGDIELQNHWHTVLAHRATAQSPPFISTGFSYFLKDFFKKKYVENFQFLV